MSLLLDTGVLYAFLNKRDAHHAQAKELLLAISEGALGTPAVTDLVIAELHNLLRAIRNTPPIEDAARRLVDGKDPAIANLHRLQVGLERYDRVHDLYERHRDARISFTDASLLCMREEHGIDHIATFDKRLAALARSLPRND